MIDPFADYAGLALLMLSVKLDAYSGIKINSKGATRPWDWFDPRYAGFDWQKAKNSSTYPLTSPESTENLQLLTKQYPTSTYVQGGRLCNEKGLLKFSISATRLSIVKKCFKTLK